MTRKLDIRTYSDYIDLKNVPTKPFLMISELIDNSISSFDNHYGEDEWGEVLEVKVDFYFDKNKNQKIHNTKNLINSYIEVIDNAFGMGVEQLIDAIILNKKNKNSLSLMNRHGRGLKQCAFYFGADLYIETWNENNDISYINLITSSHDSDESVYLESHKKNKINLFSLKKRGTSIRIEKIHSNRFLTTNKYIELINAISFRYIKLIESGRLIIEIKSDIEKKHSTFNKIEKAVEPIVKVTRDFGYDIKTLDNKIKEVEISINNGLHGIGKNREFQKHEKLILETSDNIKNLIKKSITNPDTLFKWEQSIDINNKELNVIFWMLEKNKAKYRGYRVYEGDRAILHPPITNGENGTTTYFKSISGRSQSSGSTDNRFAGEFNIKDINASTSTDKSRFLFDDLDDEEILNLKLGLIWEVFNIYVLVGRSAGKNEEGKTIDKKNINIIESAIKDKFVKVISEISFPKDDHILMKIFVDKKEYWLLDIYVNKILEPNKIWDSKIIENDDINKLLLTVYSSHPIWKNMQELGSFMSEALIPLTILIAHFEISNILDGSRKNMNNSYDIDFNKIDSPIEKLNKSAEIIEE